MFNSKTDKRFEVVIKKEDLGVVDVTVIRDKKTGVSYLFAETLNSAGLSPLLEADGKPVADEIE